MAETLVDVAPSDWFASVNKIAGRIKLTKPLHILYLGDSLSDYDRGRNYVDKVNFFLNKYNPGKANSRNYGVSGDDISRVCARIAGNAKAIRKKRYSGLFDRKYDVAFIFLGHNDTKASSANDYKIALIPPVRQEQYYRTLIAKLRTEGIPRIVLVSQLPLISKFAKKMPGKRQVVRIIVSASRNILKLMTPY